MEMIGIALAAIAAVPALGWLYVRTIGKRHTIDFHHGNMSLAKVVSTNPRHNDKLALVTVGLTFTNGGPHPLTIKDVVLQYKFRGKKKAELVRVSTGSVQGDECVLTVNADAAERQAAHG